MMNFECLTMNSNKHFSKLLIFVLSLILNSKLYSQSIQIDTLSLLNEHVSQKFSYPLIKTGNYKVDSILNFEVLNEVTDYEFADSLSINSLIEWQKDGINNLYFNLTYNSNNIFSLIVGYEVCIAYCTHVEKYFNYSSSTGKKINISDILKKPFEGILHTNRSLQYIQQRKELKQFFLEEDSELDLAGYNWALDSYDYCEKEGIKSFSLYTNYIEFHDECYLPNAIKNLTPTIELKFDYNHIQEYLKIGLKK